MNNASEKVSFWVRKTHLLRSDEYICDACGYVADRPLKVCPGCGSKMKKSKYDPSWVDEAEMLDMFLG